MRKRGFSLLATMSFIIVIVFMISQNLEYIKKALTVNNNTNMILQTKLLVDDVLNLLQKKSIDTELDATTILKETITTYSNISIKSDDIDILILATSARDKIDINRLKMDNYLKEGFKKYLINKNISSPDYFLELLLDCMAQDSNNYNTDIFINIPTLQREKIVSLQHLNTIVEYYAHNYNDQNIQEINFKDIFNFGDGNGKVDLNYANNDVWQILLPNLDETITEELASNTLTYLNSSDLIKAGLTQNDISILSNGVASYYEPIIRIELYIKNKDSHNLVTFEYNLTSKKGDNFEFFI
jgi:hypothetical protein